MLNEIYFNFLAPLEDFGIVPPDKIMPDISTGRMFSGFLRTKGIDPDQFPTYEHEFVDGSRPTVYARLYPIKYLEAFREYFNAVWLPTKAKKYLDERFPQALPYLSRITALPSHEKMERLPPAQAKGSRMPNRGVIRDRQGNR